MSREIKILGAIIIVVGVVAVFGTRYYRSSVEKEPVKSTNKSGGSSELLVRADSPTIGPADAKVTIVEFLDPECESCGAFNPAVKSILKDFEGKVRLVIRYMPLHPNSLTAATFLEEAGEQGKYWEAHDLLLRNQPEWGTKHGPPGTLQPDIKPLFEKYASQLGLDSVKLDQAYADNRYAAKIERDRRDGQALGVRQTPTFFVNGRQLARLDEQAMRYLIGEELKRQDQ